MQAQKSALQVSEKAASSVSDFASAGVLDFISGKTANVDRNLNAAESYWFWANRHPWVGSATRMISDSISSEGYEIVDPSNTRDQDEIDADPKVQAIRVIIDHPNNDQRLSDLIGEIALDLDVVGRSFVHILRFGKTMVGLERIDARTMFPRIADNGKKIETFTQRIRLNGLMSYQEFDPADIIFFKLPGGGDIVGGESLIEMLDLTLAVDHSSRKHNAAFFRNGAKAGTVLINKKLDRDQLTLNKASLEATKIGPDNAYRPLILAGEWDVHQPTTQDDEAFTKGQDRALADVCAVFRVPESVTKEH